MPRELIGIFVRALCEVLGEEQANAVVSEIFKRLDPDLREKLANTIIKSVGIKDGKAICLKLDEPGEDAELSIDEIYKIREGTTLPVIYERFGDDTPNILVEFVKKHFPESPQVAFLIANKIEKGRKESPSIEDFDAFLNEASGELILVIKYPKEEPARMYYSVKGPGLIAELYAFVKALLEGYNGVKYKKKEIDGSTVYVIFELLRFFLEGVRILAHDLKRGLEVPGKREPQG